MAAIYDSMCRELDELFVEIREFTEQHIQCKLKIEKITNDGFLNIAKSRYINGSSTVTTLQLPTEFSKPLEPLATVVREESGDDRSFKVVRRSSIIKQNIDSNDEGVRQRTCKTTDLNLKEVGEREKPLTDPIRLFGVLVPQSLRMAQTSFIEAVNLCAESAEIQCKLTEKIVRYSELLKKKEILLGK